MRHILLFLALFLVKRVAFGRIPVITDNHKTTARQQDNDILAQFEVDIQHDDWSRHIGQSKWLKMGSQMCQMFLTDEEKHKNTLDKIKNVHSQIANNCREYENVLGDGSVKNVEKLRQQLANSILGENGEKANAFLANPFMPIEKNQLAGIHETENDRLAGRRYFTILQQMVAKLPATSGLRLAIEQQLERNEQELQHQNGGGNAKAVKASYLSLNATLDLFQLLWGQFFDEKGMPMPAAEHVLRGGVQNADHAPHYHGRVKRQQQGLDLFICVVVLLLLCVFGPKVIIALFSTGASVFIVAMLAYFYMMNNVPGGRR